MKQIIVIFGILLIAVNLLFGYLLTTYLWKAAIVTSGALVVETALMLLVSIVKLKDAFRASLYVLFPLLAVAQFVTLLFVPNEGYDSVCYVIAAGIFLLQVLLILAANTVSNRV